MLQPVTSVFLGVGHYLSVCWKIPALGAEEQPPQLCYIYRKSFTGEYEAE